MRDPQGGRLWFRTGDYGFVSKEDGALHFSGRQDDMVKVRGNRVGTVEIESALCSLSAVRGAAVAVVREGEISALNCAEDVPMEASAMELEKARLRAASKNASIIHDPSKMLLQEEKLPKLPNGKVDRRSVKKFWQKRLWMMNQRFQ